MISSCITTGSRLFPPLKDREGLKQKIRLGLEMTSANMHALTDDDYEKQAAVVRPFCLFSDSDIDSE